MNWIVVALRTLKTSRLFAALAMAALFVPGSVTANFGYGPWAEQLGINMDVSYSGKRVMHTSHGVIEMLEKRAPQKTRMDFEREGVKGAMIIREDLDKAYVLMHSMGMYRETTMSEAMDQANSEVPVTEVERIGPESVLGHDTMKYRAKFSDEEGNAEGFIWVSTHGIPVQLHMTYVDGSGRGEELRSELLGLQVGDQNPEDFEVPSNMRPMNLGNLIPGLSSPPSGGGNSAGGNEVQGEQLRKALEEMRKRLQQN